MPQEQDVPAEEQPVEPDPAEIDGVDEADTDTAELLLAGAILLLLLSGDDDGHGVVPWAWLVRRKLGSTLMNFMTRSGTDFARQTKASSAKQAEVVDRAVERAFETAIADVASRVGQAAEALFGPTGRPPAEVGPELHQRAENASKGLGRETAVFSREQARMHTAMDFGATEKIWRTRHDQKVRNSHSVMEGQRRKLDEPFLSGLGNLLMCPGDPDAPPSDTFGCRCRNSYRIPLKTSDEVQGAPGEE